MNQNPEITFIGVGNRFRSDDAVGLQVLDILSSGCSIRAEYLEAWGEGATLIDMIEGKNIVFIFDAVSSDSEPGTIFRFDAISEKIPTKFFNYSTHAFSLAEAIELARVLGKLPSSLIVYGVEGAVFEAGSLLSSRVAKAVSKVVKRVSVELADLDKTKYELEEDSHA